MMENTKHVLEADCRSPSCVRTKMVADGGCQEFR